MLTVELPSSSLLSKKTVTKWTSKAGEASCGMMLWQPRKKQPQPQFCTRRSDEINSSSSLQSRKAAKREARRAVLTNAT